MGRHFSKLAAFVTFASYFAATVVAPIFHGPIGGCRGLAKGSCCSAAESHEHVHPTPCCGHSEDHGQHLTAEHACGDESHDHDHAHLHGENKLKVPAWRQADRSCSACSICEFMAQVYCIEFSETEIYSEELIESASDTGSEIPLLLLEWFAPARAPPVV